MGIPRIGTRAGALGTLVAVLLALAGAGCGAGGHRTASTTVAAVTPNGRQIGKLSTPGTPKGEQVAHLVVVASATEPRAAMALLPVHIDAQGPFPFAVDTGASRSLISGRLARRLGLPLSGSEHTVYGITGGAKAVEVTIATWTAGSILLPATKIAALSASAEEPRVRRSGQGVAGPVGLLGSDVLSRFGKIAVDYDRGLLILDPPVK